MNQLPKSVGAGNPHATFCGNRGRATASGDPVDVENGAMVEPLRHRQTKGAATDMPGLLPPRHIPTLPIPEIQSETLPACSRSVLALRGFNAENELFCIAVGVHPERCRRGLALLWLGGQAGRLARGMLPPR